MQWSRGLIVTCRNVTCVGSSVQVETCQCREWSRGLIVTCRNVTCVGSSVQVETCQCSEWSRGLIVTCLNVTCVASSVQVETCQCSEWSRDLIVRVNAHQTRAVTDSPLTASHHVIGQSTSVCNRRRASDPEANTVRAVCYGARHPAYYSPLIKLGLHRVMRTRRCPD